MYNSYLYLIKSPINNVGKEMEPTSSAKMIQFVKEIKGF